MRFTTQNLSYTDPNEDCYLDPSDPLYSVVYPGRSQVVSQASDHFDLRAQAQAKGIRPGTPAWFAMTQSSRH